MKPAEQGRALKKADLRQYRAETTFLSEGSIRFSGGLFQPAQRTWRICPAGVKGRQKSVVLALHSSQGRVWCRGPVLVYGVKELVFRQAASPQGCPSERGARMVGGDGVHRVPTDSEFGKEKPLVAWGVLLTPSSFQLSVFTSFSGRKRNPLHSIRWALKLTAS